MSTHENLQAAFAGESQANRKYLAYAAKAAAEGLPVVDLATADLAATGGRQAQQMVGAVTGLTSGKHTISIVNRGPGPVSVDAIVVQ